MGDYAMEEDDALDELPVVILDSSMSKSFSFEMPDAAVIAEQRRLAREQEEEIAKFRLDETSVEENIPDEIKEIQKPPEINMPVDHPGIDFKDLNRMDVIGKFDRARRMFLTFLMNELPVWDDSTLSKHLKWYTDSLITCMTTNPGSFNSDDIHINIVAIVLLYLDKSCRKFIDVLTMQEIIVNLLDHVARPLQSEVLLLEIAEHLLKVIPNYHNRLAVYSFLCSKNINSQCLNLPSNFSKKLSVVFLVDSLSEMVGHSKPMYRCNFSINDLNEMVVCAPKLHLLNPHEQYCMVWQIINVIRDISTEDDEATLTKLMKFLNGIKSNDHWNSGEFLKVKNLILKMKMFTQKSVVAHTNNPRKQTPKKQVFDNSDKIMD